LLKFNLRKGSLLYLPGRFLSSNVYIIAIDNEAVAVDCGMSWTAKRLLEYLNRNRLKLEYILLTHSHFDHVMGMNRVKERMQTKVVAHIRSKRGDVKVKDGDIINALNHQLSFLVKYTGLHKADHVWYYEKNNKLLFVGDYLPTQIELKTLKEKHQAESKIILPGHGKPTFPETFPYEVEENLRQD